MNRVPLEPITPALIRVVPAAGKDWMFEYPRLDRRVYPMFHAALEKLESGRHQEAERDLRLLIEAYPEFIDAQHHLAIILSETRREREARELWAAAAEMGLGALPAEFKPGNHRLPWGILDNRPFLRAYHGFGLQLFDDKEYLDSSDVWNDILSFNPDDNQGVRALAISCSFYLGKPEDVLDVCKKYKNDTMEDVLYGRALALFQLKRLPEARGALLQAVRYLPHIGEELLRKTHRLPKDANPAFVTHGGKDQAFYYWQASGTHWKKTAGAQLFVAEVLARGR